MLKVVSLPAFMLIKYGHMICLKWYLTPIINHSIIQSVPRYQKVQIFSRSGLWVNTASQQPNESVS